MSPAPPDLFLSPDLTNEQAEQYLQALGFRDPAAAEHNLRTMADDVAVREALGRVAEVLLGALLRAPSPDAALVGFSRYLAARTAKATFLEYARDDPAALQVLVDVLGASPFLTEILVRNPEYFHWLISEIDRRDRAARHAACSEALASDDDTGTSALDALKRLKRREILRVAARDILGRETVASATAQLSDLADWLVEGTLDIVSKQLLRREGLGRLPGLFAVIGLGKLGGGELNYSSDIDLLYAYQPDDQEDVGAHDFFRRLARELTAALGEHTDESYMYRVDLRLRPMGGRGAIAYSLVEYDRYYAAWGETFERFALIKARPIAGDAGAGRRFVDLVRPFVFRTYIDHAALEEISRYKERTDRALQDGENDRNVKLGRGGIREVELFTQVLQLTYGGQQAELRVGNTLVALDRLRENGVISDRVWTDLMGAYVFLRTVEHRLQLVHERQTHSLSRETLELEVTARRLGFRSREQMDAELQAHRDRVHEIYRGLVVQRPGADTFGGRRFFRMLSDVSDEEALAHLRTCGLREPAFALEAIRALEQQACLTHAPSTARNVLANLLGVWMEAVARATRPEAVLNRFERLSARTGAATLFYQTLLEHHGLRDALLNVLDSGELLSERVIRYPELLDSLPAVSVDVESLNRSFTASLQSLRRTERMNQVRRFKLMTEFKILVEWLSGGAPGEIQEKLSLLADCCVEHAAHWGTIAVPIAGQHDDAQWAIVALGKLGGRELAVHSDLDLVVLYDGDPTDSATFARFQSFVEALQAFIEEPTSEGVAYRIDTRLRPEGTKGALAMPLATFRRYLDLRAEPWERVAWTRCRILIGTSRIAQELHAIVTNFVYGPWKPAVVPYMRRIRTRMERELAHEGATRIDFKVGRGGLADIDFLLQLVQIREGELRPEFRKAGTRALLAKLPETRYVRIEEGALLREAHMFLRQLEMVARMESDSDISWVTPQPAILAALGARLARLGTPSDDVLDVYRRITEQVRAVHETVLSRLEN